MKKYKLVDNDYKIISNFKHNLHPGLNPKFLLHTHCTLNLVLIQTSQCTFPWISPCNNSVKQVRIFFLTITGRTLKAFKTSLSNVTYTFLESLLPTHSYLFFAVPLHLEHFQPLQQPMDKFIHLFPYPLKN